MWKPLLAVTVVCLVPYSLHELAPGFAFKGIAWSFMTVQRPQIENRRQLQERDQSKGRRARGRKGRTEWYWNTSRIWGDPQIWLSDLDTKRTVRSFLDQYTPGLIQARRRAMQHRQGQTNDEEGAIHYMRIRRFKPKVVWECSPGVGFSSVYILSALLDNAIEDHVVGHLYSFGLGHAEHILSIMNRTSLALMKYWTYRKGDFKEVVNGNAVLNPDSVNASVASIPAPDYVYLDADHSVDFAKWYTKLFLAKFPGHVPVSIHDIYNWANRTDQPVVTHEGIVVLEWLWKSKTCNTFTISPLVKPQLYEDLKEMLWSDFGADGQERIMRKYTYNPTIWFELNC